MQTNKDLFDEIARPKPCPQCRCVGFHKMDCTRSYAESEEEHTRSYQENADKFLSSSHERGSTTSFGLLAGGHGTPK